MYRINSGGGKIVSKKPIFKAKCQKYWLFAGCSGKMTELPLL